MSKALHFILHAEVGMAEWVVCRILQGGIAAAAVFVVMFWSY